MPKYDTLAPNYGKETVRVLKRVKQSRGTIVANFYAVIGGDDSTLLSATFTKKDREGRACRQRAMDADDRKASGIPKGGRSARGVLVLTKAGDLMFWCLTELSVQGAAATDKQLRLGLKKLCETADEFRVFKGRVDVGSGTRGAFDDWYSSWAKAEDGAFRDGNLDSLADEMDIGRDELRELIADSSALGDLLDAMVERDEPLEDDPLLERSFELSERVADILARVGSDDVEAARAAFTEAFEDAGAAEWPTVYRNEATAFGERAAALARTEMSAAVSTYQEGVRLIKQRASLKEELDGAGKRIHSMVIEARTLLTGYVGALVPDGRVPLRLEALTEQAEEAVAAERRFDSAMEAGDWPGALAMSGAVRKAARTAHVDLLNYPFEDSLALAVSQGTYSPDDGDVALLVELGNAGVCVAMALDWLGHGGSLADGGEPIRGAVAMSHLKWQAVYELGDELSVQGETGAAQVVMGERGLRSAAEVERGVERLEREIDRLARLIVGTEPFARSRHRTVKRLQSDLERFEGDTLEQLADDTQRRIDRILEEVRRRFALADHAKALSAELEEAKETLSLEGHTLTQETEEKLERVREMGATCDRLNHSWRSDLVAEKHLPDSAFRAYGLVPKKGTGSETALGESVAASATAFLDEMLDRPVDDEEVRFNITIQLSGGAHALAARVKGPEPGGDVWDIELFDPNFGGFRFDNRARAVQWFVHLATVNYASNPWSSLSRYEVETRGDGPSSGGLHHHDPAEDWTRDYMLATQHLPTVRKLRPAPRRAVEHLEALKSTIDRLVSGAPTAMDYQIARPKLAKLREGVLWLASTGPEVFQRWEFLSLNLDADNPRHDGALSTFSRALRCWEEGDVTTGLEDFRAAFAQFISLGV